MNGSDAHNDHAHEGLLSTAHRIDLPHRSVREASPAKKERRTLFSVENCDDEDVAGPAAEDSFLFATATTSGGGSDPSSNELRQPQKPEQPKPTKHRPVESHPRYTPQTQYVQLNDDLVPLELWMDDDEEDSNVGRRQNYKFRKGKLLTQEDCVGSHFLRKKYQKYALACKRKGMIPCSRMLRLLGAEDIDLGHQNLGDDNFRNILVSRAITEVCTRLNLKENGLSDDGGHMLAEYFTPTFSPVAVAGLPNLTALGLAGNNLGPDGGEALARALVFTPRLQILDLKNNQITDEVVVAISESVKSWAQEKEDKETVNAHDLRAINLSYNAICDRGAVALGDIIQCNPSISEIKLTFCNITDEGLRYICDSFGPHPSLRELRLGYNAVGTLGGIYIAETIARCPLLRYLDARENRIGTQAAVSMAEAMRMSRNLKVVRLGNNPFSSIGVNSILSNLNAMPRVTVEALSMVHCPEAEPETYTPRRILDEQHSGYEYNLDLADPIQHCVSELLRTRTKLAYGCTWVQPLINGEPLNLSRYTNMPRTGHVTFTLIPGTLGGQRSLGKSRRASVAISDHADAEDDNQASDATEEDERDPIPDEDLIRERLQKIEELGLLKTLKKIENHLRVQKGTIQDMFKSADMVTFDRARCKEAMDRYGCKTSVQEVDSIFRMVAFSKPKRNKADKDPNVLGIEANDFDNCLRAYKRDYIMLEKFGFTDLKSFIRNVHVTIADPPFVSLMLSMPRDIKLFHIINGTDSLVKDELSKTVWKHISLDSYPVDELRETVTKTAVTKRAHLEFEWHDRTIYMTQNVSRKLSNKAARAEATKLLQAQILLLEHKDINVKDFVVRKSSDDEDAKITKAESEELLKSFLVYDPDVIERPPIVNLPTEGEMSYRIAPVKPVVLFAEKWRGMNMLNSAARLKVETQLKRCFSEFGECIVHLYIDNKVAWPIMTDKFQLPSSGTVALTFVMLRPRSMLRSMKTYDYEFDLSNELERHKAIFLRDFIVHSSVPQRALWRDTTWDPGNGRPLQDIHFVEVSSPDLWEMPTEGILKCTFVDFRMRKPIQANIFKFICKLLEETTSECERVMVITFIFQSDEEANQKERARDPFYITAKMAKQLVGMFSTQAAKDEAYHAMRSHIVDPQNAIDLEGKNIGRAIINGNDDEYFRRASTFVLGAAGRDSRRFGHGMRFSEFNAKRMKGGQGAGHGKVPMKGIQRLDTMHLDART